MDNIKGYAVTLTVETFNGETVHGVVPVERSRYPDLSGSDNAEDIAREYVDGLGGRVLSVDAVRPIRTE